MDTAITISDKKRPARQKNHSKPRTSTLHNSPKRTAFGNYHRKENTRSVSIPLRLQDLSGLPPRFCQSRPIKVGKATVLKGIEPHVEADWSFEAAFEQQDRSSGQH